MRTLIIGVSGGIGAALMQAAATAGDEVVGLSRHDHGLDVTDEASIERHLGALNGPFDRIIVATGALEIAGAGPEKSLRSLDPAVLAAQFALNATGPALVLKHALRLMPRDRPARFGVLSARVGSIGDNRLGGWYSYRAAKAALNQLIHSAAIEIARTHPQAVVACLHPGTVATQFTQNYDTKYDKSTPNAAATALMAVLDGLSPDQSGGFYDATGTEIVW
jgi:NAD(P)-dependent dehydrogenase (short-subunit alcohol dehydrogenase family)